MTRILYGMPVADAIDRWTGAQFICSPRFQIRGMPTLSIIRIDPERSETAVKTASAINTCAGIFGIKTDIVDMHGNNCAGIRSIIEDACSHLNNYVVVTGSSTALKNAHMWTDDMSGYVCTNDLDATCASTLARFYNEGHSQFAPAVAIAVLAILRYYKIDFVKRPVIVLGRSIRVGRAISHLLSQFDATVTMIHRKTPERYKHEMLWNNPDAIIITATGSSNIPFLEETRNQVIVNVGLHKEDGRLCGDMSDELLNLHTYTPVTGGIDAIIPSIICAKMAFNGTSTLMEYIMSDKFPNFTTHNMDKEGLIKMSHHHLRDNVLMYTLDQNTERAVVVFPAGIQVTVMADADDSIPRYVPVLTNTEQEVLISYGKATRKLIISYSSKTKIPGDGVPVDIYEYER